MLRFDAELGSTVRVRTLLQTSGVPETGKTVNVYVKRDSDGMMYDFDSDAFSAAPVTPYDAMTEDTDLPGTYYLDLDTEDLLVEDVLTYYVAEATLPFVEVQQVRLVKPVHAYSVSGVVAHNYESGHTYLAACLLDADGVVTSADRARLTVVRGTDGTKLLDAYEVASSVGGVFVHEVTSLGLASHTPYFLVAKLDLGTQTYSGSQSFAVL